MSSEAQVALLVGIIAAVVALVVGIVSAASALVGALGATIVGWFLNRKTQVRTDKRAAFVEFLSAMDECQHTALDLRIAVAAKDTDEVARLKVRVAAAIKRVDTARSVAALDLPSQHLTTLNDAVMACIKETHNAVRDPSASLLIHEAWKAVLALAQKEIGQKA